MSKYEHWTYVLYFKKRMFFFNLCCIVVSSRVCNACLFGKKMEMTRSSLAHASMCGEERDGPWTTWVGACALNRST